MGEFMNLEILEICNRRLNSDIEIIRNIILQRFSRIDAIILCGGYGRGEGSWIIEKSTKKVYPYNDYDLYIVTDMKLSLKKISEIENEISKKVGLRWIDIDTITKVKLTNLKPSIKNIDLKYASKIIYGDMNILKEIPDINPSNISTVDIETLYFTRLWTFMGSLSEKGFINLT
jgi:predicted nucleotidyltransferase